jgi:hypothetical protein
MRAELIGLTLLAGLLAGCSGKPTDKAEKAPARYSGVGIYEASRLWQEMAAVDPSSDPMAAKLVDDEHIIVVVDSHTGEIRQCGDLSGYCVTTNPWAANGTVSPTLPAKLKKHRVDLDEEERTSNLSSSNESNAAEPAASGTSR